MKPESWEYKNERDEKFLRENNETIKQGYEKLSAPQILKKKEFRRLPSLS
jgi:hypothetical protein